MKLKDETDLLRETNRQLLEQNEQCAHQFESLQSEFTREMARLKLAHNEVITGMKTTRGVEITEIYRAHASEMARLHHAHLEALARQSLAFADAGTTRMPKELRAA
ncbi:MAG TPA: hypothetical protein VNT99_08205 [Methylomirabilota bacterium]|nr:hypothetical protein [Methylomirabilota bacterium]